MDEKLNKIKRNINEFPVREHLQRAGEAAQSATQAAVVNINDPVHNPLRTGQRVVEATKTVVYQHTSERNRGPHSVKAQKMVFIKGVVDVLQSLSLIFFPSLLYDGPIPRLISMITTLTQAQWEIDSPSAFALASFIMGAGVAGICASESMSDDAYKIIATLNGVFAAMSMLGCILAPSTFGSSFLFLVGLQNIFWFYAIVDAGNYGVRDTLGLSWKAIEHESEKLLRRDIAEQGVKEVFEDSTKNGNTPRDVDEGDSGQVFDISAYADYKATRIN